MVDLNKEVYQQKAELILHKSANADEIIKAKMELESKLHKRYAMIIGEGSIFLLLMVLGIMKVRDTFKTEAFLAKQQKNFLLSITHELKSPIASAKLQLQTLLKRELTKEKQQELITNAISDTDRLNDLVENILLAAKIDASAFPLQKEEVNLSDFIRNTLSKAIPLTDKHQVKLNIESGIYYPIDQLAFASIILNLLENAMKYSPENSVITVHLSQQEGKIKLSFTDEGAGIKDAEKQFIFKKFYRIGREETRKSKGTGLGLYIVKYLVEQHKGQIFVRDNSPKGSIFEIVFNG